MCSIYRRNQVDNLFDDSQLKNKMSLHINDIINETNSVADDDCKVFLTKDFDFQTVGLQK